MADRKSRNGRALPQRQAIGRRVRAYRTVLSITSRDVCQHTGVGKAQVYAVESATSDVFAGTLIDVAATVGLHVALAADHHLPLLELTAGEVDAIHDALAVLVENDSLIGPLVSSAMEKLTATGDPEGGTSRG